MDVFKIVGKIALEGKDSFDKSVNSASKMGSALAKTLGKGLAVAIGAATAAMVALSKSSLDAYSNYEQLAGGMEKIFGSMDTSKIAMDAAEAYKILGMSASDYLAVINDVGASFSATMGSEAGYEVAKKGLTAISDYASGTGKSFDELQGKFAMITRSTSSYQSIADQFSGILPATSKDFLAQAQACGFLDKKYRELTKVPIAEYQQAVSDMLAQGVENLNLTGNTAAEAASTISGSLNMAKAAWKNLLVGFAAGTQDLSVLIGNFVESVTAAARNIVPKLAQILGGLTVALAEIIPIVTAELPGLLQELLPGIIEGAIALVSGLVSALPAVISVLFDSIKQFVTQKIPEMFPGLADALSGVQTFFEDIGTYIGEQFAPIFGDVATAFDTVKEKIQPLIDKFSEYATSGQLATDASNLLKDAIGFVADAVGWAVDALAGFADWCSAHQFTIESTAVIVGSFATAWTLVNGAMTLWTAIGGAATAVTTAFGSAMAFLTSPIALVVAAIGAVIAIVVLCITHWDQIKAKASEIASAISGAWESIRAAIASAVASAVATVTSKFSEIKQQVESKVNDAKAQVQSAFETIKSDIENALNQAKEKVQQIWDNIKNVFTDAAAIGSKIIEDIKSGIEGAWEGLTSWFKGIWDGLFGNLTANVNVNASASGVDGSHADGLSYVPFDGYVAELHRGEMVLTASEARLLRSGAGGSVGNAEIANILTMILDAVQEGNSQEMVMTLNHREFGRAVRGVVHA